MSPSGFIRGGRSRQRVVSTFMLSRSDHAHKCVYLLWPVLRENNYGNAVGRSKNVILTGVVHRLPTAVAPRLEGRCN